MNSTLQRSLFVAALIAAPFSTQLTACAGQGEGERCERKNGNDDCQEGLTCKSSKDLGGNADICCPAGNSESSECKLSGGATSSTGTDMSTSTSTGMGGGGASSSSSSSDASSSASTTTSSASGTGGAGGGSSSSSGGGG
jgi:hypothetical protein